MRRREFIILLGGGATVTWPIAARAQQGEHTRHLGVLVTALEKDPEVQSWRMTFLKQLRELGWIEGRNLTVDYRFGVTGVNRMPDFGKELIALQPDVILAGGTAAVAALRQSTFSIPIVFTQVPDPIEVGLVTSVAHPGGNISGFTNFEPSVAGKWPQALKELRPDISQIAIFFDPDNPSWVVYVRALEAAAQALGVRLTPAGVRDAGEIGRVMETLAREAGVGLVVLPGPVTINYRDNIIASAAHHRLLAVYPYRFFATAGGLLSYGVDVADTYRRAATYVDRILRGEKVGGLPVQAPTKFELVINLNSAKALGLAVPPTLLASADEVIE